VSALLSLVFEALTKEHSVPRAFDFCRDTEASVGLYASLTLDATWPEGKTAKKAAPEMEAIVVVGKAKRIL
jgi:hypothetical protein